MNCNYGYKYNYFYRTECHYTHTHTHTHTHTPTHTHTHTHTHVYSKKGSDIHYMVHCMWLPPWREWSTAIPTCLSFHYCFAYFMSKRGLSMSPWGLSMSLWVLHCIATQCSIYTAAGDTSDTSDTSVLWITAIYSLVPCIENIRLALGLGQTVLVPSLEHAVEIRL